LRQSTRMLLRQCTRMLLRQCTRMLLRQCTRVSLRRRLPQSGGVASGVWQLMLKRRRSRWPLVH
jgi:hypothetical protein